MLDPDKINYYLNLFEDIRFDDLLELFKLAKERHFAAGETIITEGTLSNKLFYVRRGLIRSFAIKENGEEVTVLLRWEDQFFASHDTIFFNRPSRFNYQA